MDGNLQWLCYLSSTSMLSYISFPSHLYLYLYFPLGGRSFLLLLIGLSLCLSFK